MARRGSSLMRRTRSAGAVGGTGPWSTDFTQETVAARPSRHVREERAGSATAAGRFCFRPLRQSRGSPAASLPLPRCESAATPRAAHRGAVADRPLRQRRARGLRRRPLVPGTRWA
jgi:hypothetical protein